MRYNKLHSLVRLGLFWVAAGRAHTLSPPIAEYRQKADGMLTLGNNGDTSLVALLEVRTFSVDDDGNLLYRPPDPGIRVQWGSDSFLIPPHQVHYMFYKATRERAPCWFAIINNLTAANRVTSGLRINIVRRASKPSNVAP